MTLRELLVGHSVGRSLIRGLTIAALLMAVSRFVFVPVRAHGISMMPTYEEGQFLFFNRLAYRYAPIRRGDIVAVTLLGGEAVLVKRVIALPGESVRIEGGEVYVNGKALAEPYVKYHIPWNIDEVQVEADEVFVIGDNRSMPSRLHDFGRATLSRILGRAIY
jgi:signal peptidase I